MTTHRLTFRANGDANSYALLDADTGNWFMSLQVNGQQMEAKQVENLRRLAATWNACDGIPTEALERVEGDTTPVFELLMPTTRERDALRTALNNLLNTVNQYDDGDYYLGTDAEQILAEANRVSIETAEPAPPPCQPDTQPPSQTAPSPVCANSRSSARAHSAPRSPCVTTP